MVDPKQKFFLLKQSEYFCAAPWANLYLDSDGSVRTCCVGKQVLGNINTDSLDDILNSNIAVDIRNTLVKDQPHSNCVNCYNIGSNTDKWMRSHYNNLLKTHQFDFDHNQFSLGSVDLRWSNTCNFKCIYCSPLFSSSIASEQGVTIPAIIDIKNFEMLKFVLANQDAIQEIYLAGGEPLLMKENIEFLTQFKNKKVKLRINTNLSNIHEKNNILNVIKEYENILWTISVDNVGNRYNYTRYGGQWSQFCDNLKAIQAYGQIRFNMVYFIGNAITIDQDFQTLRNLVPSCEFSMVPVDGNSPIQAKNLPKHLKTSALAKLTDLLGIANNQGLCNNINNCISELNTDPTDSNYSNFFNNIDQLRGTNWKEVFPELAL